MVGFALGDIQHQKGEDVEAPYRLREYQRDGIDSVEEHFVAHQRVLGVLFTGGGKTIMAADLLHRRAKLGRAIALAHRLELVEQLADKISSVTGLDCDIEMADRRASHLIKAPIVISSIQTQIAGRNGSRRMHDFSPSEFATVICDEAHHHVSDNTYGAVCDHYLSNPNCKLLGLTATPKRTDQIALGSVYESVAFRMGIADGIAEGWLVPMRVRYVRIAGLDLSGVGTTGGDYTQRDLGRVMDEEQTLKATALATLEHGAGRKGLVFCASVEQAHDLTTLLNAAKPGSAHIVTGETPTEQRRAIIDGYRKSQFQWLVNYAVLLEGFDVWGTSCIVCARPTKNALLLEQMIGRGTRPDAAAIAGMDSASGRRAAIAASVKPDGLIIDFKGVVGKHKPARAIDVLGGKMPEEVRDRIEELLDAGCDDIGRAQAHVEQEFENARLEAIKCQPATLRGKVKYAAIEAFNLFDIEHVPGSHPIESWQKEKLEKWRMPLPATTEEAQDLIDEVRRRARLGLCTYKMARQLKRRSHDPNMPFEQAKELMQEWFGDR